MKSYILAFNSLRDIVHSHLLRVLRSPTHKHHTYINDCLTQVIAN